MALGFIKRLLGAADTPAPNPDPFKREEPPPPAVLTEPSVITPPPPRPSVGRDEIIDAQTRISGYRYRVSENGAGPAAVVQALCDAGVRNMAQRRVALLPMTPERWRAADYRPLIGPQTHFLFASLEAAEPAVLAEIKAAGGWAAVQLKEVDLALRVRMQEFALMFIDYTAFQLQAFERQVRELRRVAPKMPVMADGIASWPERRLCDSLGVHFCLGGFIASFDEDNPVEKLSESRLILLEMLNQLRQEGELEQLAELARRDPAVSVQLISMANSPMMALDSPITGVEQAMLVLGRAQLYRWLALAMFRVGGNRGKDESLLELALTRGRFLELVAEETCTPSQCEELFLVGLLSVFDALLGQPMSRILSTMHLPENVRAVLLESEGPYTRLLMLAFSVERGRQEQVGRLSQLLGLSQEQVQRSSEAALAWAEEATGFGG